MLRNLISRKAEREINSLSLLHWVNWYGLLIEQPCCATWSPARQKEKLTHLVYYIGSIDMGIWAPKRDEQLELRWNKETSSYVYFDTELKTSSDKKPLVRNLRSQTVSEQSSTVTPQKPVYSPPPPLFKESEPVKSPPPPPPPPLPIVPEEIKPEHQIWIARSIISK